MENTSKDGAVHIISIHIYLYVCGQVRYSLCVCVFFSFKIGIVTLNLLFGNTTNLSVPFAATQLLVSFAASY